MTVEPGVTDYAQQATPAGYVCTSCRRRGCKLWREYQTMLDHTNLYCVECACRSQSKSDKQYNAALIGPDGKMPWYHGNHFMGMIDQIGWLVPAIPTEEGDTYWGYTSVPEAGIDWWRHLPNG